MLGKISVLPEEFEIVKPKPLFNKSSKTSPKNYKPISLSVMSKIIGKSIHCYLEDYFFKNSLLYNY